MKLAILVSFALCAVTQAHMGMTLAGVVPREKLKLGDNYRSPNPKVCHGTPRIGVQKTVAAGATMNGKMSGGAAHGGGQCSMIVSVDEKKWYKIGDYKDCTTKGGLSFVMPKGVPKACSGDAGCTFGWLWTPMLSGTCEIYMNCYAIKVTGAMGGIETAPNRAISLPISKCIRPNSRTKLTTMFGFIIGSNAPDPYKANVATTKATPKPGQTLAPTTRAPDNAPITIIADSNSPKCKPGQLLLETGLPAVHKVADPKCGYQSEYTDAAKKAADVREKCLATTTLSGISALYDLRCRGDGCNTWQQIFELNKCQNGETSSCAGGNIPKCMSNPDLICVSQLIKLPQSECGESPCGANGAWVKDRQRCFCEDAYTGSQCQFRRDGVAAGGSVTETITRGVVLGLGVIALFMI